MKKIISLIAAMVLFCSLIPVATAEDEVYLRLVGGSGRVGGTVTVDVIAENAPDCIGMNMVFQYDSSILQFVSGRSGDLVESGQYPGDADSLKALGEMVEDICWKNAVKYFGFEL